MEIREILGTQYRFEFDGKFTFNGKELEKYKVYKETFSDLNNSSFVYETSIDGIDLEDAIVNFEIQLVNEDES
jgi:hypothetical protein